jgi:hypothetical protein
VYGLTSEVEKTAQGAVWRIIATIIIATAFLSGILIYIGFYAVNYSLTQKVVVFLVALIIAAAAISIMWVSWAGRRGWMHYGPAEWRQH